MYVAIAITAAFFSGVVVGQMYGRKVEQKAVAKVLSEFAAVDQEARSLVMRCWSRLADGVKAELKKIGI